MTKLIILDRDGVINYDSEHYIKSPDEWHAIPGSVEAIALLKQAGYTITVASNQSGLARGYYDHKTLQAIHNKMQLACAQAGGSIDKIYYCPHHPDDHCSCRKPKPGLLLQIAADFNCSLENAPMIGDRLTDIAAAQSVKAKPILVATSIIHLSQKEMNDVSMIEQHADLQQAVKALLKK